MRRAARLPLAAAVVAALAIVVSRGVVPAPPPGGASVAPAPRHTGATPSTEAPPDTAPERPPVPLRNPFRYADEARTGFRPQPAPALWAPVPVVSAPPEIRFLGLVRRGGGLKAALSISGDVSLVAPGEEVAGYVLLSIDEDTVRVRRPGGGEAVLRLAP